MHRAVRRAGAWQGRTPSRPPGRPLVVDVVNASHRPSVGVGRIVFDIALTRWHRHAAGDDGHCLAPDCARAWPCPPATEADLAMDGCLTHWARLDQHAHPHEHRWRPVPPKGGER